MAVPKKKTSQSRRRSRRSQAHGKVTLIQLAACSNCSHKVRPHSVCSNCGYYRGKKILVKFAA